jgi:hypothetical protein
MLLLEASEPLTVLPTHRIVRGIGDDGVARLLEGLRAAGTVTPVEADALVAAFGSASGAGGHGRFGLITRTGAYAVEARATAPAAMSEHLLRGGDALRALDVTWLAAALAAYSDVDDAAVVGSERIGYTKSAAEAAAQVRDAVDGADAAFLLEPTPVASILAVARDGDVMPQKSTYFFPKALTGLVINPHEW